QQRVAVGNGPGHVLGGDRAVGPGAVVGDYGSAEDGAEPGGEDAGNRVVGTPRRGGDDEGARLGGDLRRRHGPRGGVAAGALGAVSPAVAATPGRRRAARGSRSRTRRGRQRGRSSAASQRRYR